MKFYDQITPKIPERIEEKHAHIIGSGIAGLAAAVYLVQDAKMPGKNITIYESAPQSGRLSGSLRQRRRGLSEHGRS